MLCEYSHTESESLAQIHTIVAEIQHFFPGDCFLLAHPVHKTPCTAKAESSRCGLVEKYFIFQSFMLMF